MRVIITGGAGFIGRKLAKAILDRGTLAGADGAQTPVSGLVLFDNVQPDDFGGRAEAVTGDIADAATVRSLIGERYRQRLPSGGGGQRRGGGGFRARLPGQSGRHPQCAGGLPRAGAPAAPGVRLVHRGLWRRSAGHHRGRYAAPAADLLRHPETGRRTAHPRLHPQGLYRRPGIAPADNHGAAGAEPGGLDLGQFDHPRAAAGQGLRLPGRTAGGDGLPVAAAHDRRLHRRPRSCPATGSA